MKPRKSETTPKEVPQEGTHTARLLSIVDLGHQPGFSYQGSEIESEWKFEFTYELVAHNMEDGKPFVVSEDVANKDWENEASGLSTKLVARAKAMLGKDYKRGLEDLNHLLGAPCMVSVSHNDKGYAKVKGSAAVGSIPFGMEVPQLRNEPYLFSMDEPDVDKFNSFPEFKQNRIKAALNFHETTLFLKLQEQENKY